jgi:hypothetical protein
MGNLSCRFAKSLLLVGRSCCFQSCRHLDEEPFGVVVGSLVWVVGRVYLEVDGLVFSRTQYRVLSPESHGKELRKLCDWRAIDKWVQILLHYHDCGASYSRTHLHHSLGCKETSFGAPASRSIAASPPRDSQWRQGNLEGTLSYNFISSSD